MIGRMKGQGAAPRTARESSLAVGRMAVIVVVVGIVTSSISYVLSWGDRGQAQALSAAQATIQAMERAEASADVTPTGIVQSPVRVIPREETPTPVVLVEIVERVVTATPTVVPSATSTPVYVYVDRIVTEYIEAPAMPTPTATALAAGQVVICVHVAGVKEVYVGDRGLVSGACVDVGIVGVGQHQIPVKVNR